MRIVFAALAAAALVGLTGCPGPVAQPCEGVACGPNGQCATDGKTPVCACNPGYVADGLTCVVDKPKNACDPSPCTQAGRTVCVVANGAARCDCDPGKHEQNGACVTDNPCQPNPCTGLNQNVCSAKAGQAVCSCNAGYAPEGAGCSATPVFDCNARHSGGATDDALEPDECPTLARDIDTGGTVENAHTLSPQGDVDWVRIAAEAGRIYEVKASGLGGLRLYGDAYRADGVTPAGFDHRGQVDVLFRFRAEKTEPHFIRIRGFRSNDTGGYTLAVTDKGTDDFADATAAALELAAGSSMDGEIQFGGDADVVKLKLAALHSYELAGTGTLGNYLTLELVAEDGKTALQKEQGAAPKLSLRVPVEATYYLRVTSGMETQLGTYSVAIKDNGADDHGDVLADATPLTPGTAFANGSFERAGDTDVFSFAATLGHIYSFTCNPMPTSGSCNVTLVDAGGAVLASDVNGYSALVNYEAVKSATLYLRLASTATGVHAYSYKLEDLGADDHGDTLATATALTANAAATNGNIELNGDLDFFSFTAAPGHIYRFTCTASSTLYACGLRLLGSGGTQLFAAQNSFSYEATAAGTLYVEVKGYYANYLGTYTVRLEDLGADDFGDTPATAGALTVGAADATGNIETNGDVDVFSFAAQAGHIYRFTCIASSSLSTCYARFLNLAGTQLATGTGEASFRATAAGTYYAEARGYSTGYTGTYTYRVEDLGVDDHGDTPAAATAITVGAAPATGQLVPLNDVDYFSFSAVSAHIYRFTCTASPDLYSCAVRFTNSAGTTLASGTGTAAYAATGAGTLYVEVKAYYSTDTGSYTYRVEDLGVDDFGNEPASATALSLGATGGGNIEVTGDADVFSFTATVNRIYRFTCTPATSLSYCYVRILGAGGTQLLSTYGAPALAAYKATATGTLYVEVKGYSGYTGTYTYKLEDVGLDDHGDTVAAATALAANGTTLTGNIETGTDADVFSFSATANRIYRFSCTPSAGLYSCYIRILGPGGTQLLSTSGAPAIVPYEATATGTLYVEVKGYSGYSGTYTYALEDLGLDDYGDTPATATAISVGSPVSAKHETSTDEDWFSVTLNAGQTYQLSANVTYLTATIFQSNGVTQVATTSYPPLSFTAPSAGTYYVRTKPYSYNAATPGYTFTVQ